MLTYPEMIVIGLLQGVSELFPVSSLGHSIVVPALIGGTWARDLDMSAPGSPYLDTLVAMHVATAAALVIFFWRDWVRLVGALVSSLRKRRISTVHQRTAWLLVAGTVPVGLAGLALDKVMRVYLGKPLPSAAFLVVNGIVLFAVERLSRRASAPARTEPTHAKVPGVEVSRVEVDATAETVIIPAVRDDPADIGGVSRAHAGGGADAADARGAGGGAVLDRPDSGDAALAGLGWGAAIGIGACQILALLPGISRSGATIAGGLLRGLSHEDAARFAFLLATPVIAAAGVLKLPELARPEMHGAIGPTVAGSIAAGLGAYVSVRFLTRYFHSRTLIPFAIYCVLAGLGAFTYLALT